ARLNKVFGCFGPRVETDLPEHFAVLLGVHVVVPKGAISIKKVGCDGLDRCGQFVEQCSRLQVSTVLWVLGSFGAPPVGRLLKVQSQRFPYFVIGHFVPSGQVDWNKAVPTSRASSVGDGTTTAPWRRPIVMKAVVAALLDERISGATLVTQTLSGAPRRVRLPQRIP